MSLRPDTTNTNAKADARKNDYKPSIDADAGRRRREENLVQIRKNKREENLHKKRRENTKETIEDGVVIQKEMLMLENLPKLKETLISGKQEDMEIAAFHLRKILSLDRTPPIDAVIEAGMVPLLIHLLQNTDSCPKLQFEVAWCVTNLLSGTTEHAKVVIEAGAVPVIINMTKSADPNVREQAVWALGNIAGDSVELRDMLLNLGIVEHLLSQLTDSATTPMIRTTAWALSNCCRGKPQPDFNKVAAILPALAYLIQVNDLQTVSDACWAISYMSEGTSTKIQAVVDSGVVPQFVTLLSAAATSVLAPVLRSIGNIVSGTDEQTQCVIDEQALPLFYNLLAEPHNKKAIRKEACWAISNVTAGTTSQIQAVIDANIFPCLHDHLSNAEFDVKKEAAWAVSNATCAGTPDQICYIVNLGFIKPLCDMLECTDPRILVVCLEALYNILNVGEIQKSASGDSYNKFANLVEEAEGLDKIENLQNHAHHEVYAKAIHLLETFYSEEEDLELADVEGDISMTANPTFDFGHSGSPSVPPGGFQL